MHHDTHGSVAAAWFAESARRRAARVVELGSDAFAVLDPTYPASYDNNRIVSPTDVDGLRLVGLADEVLGAAGLEHRRVDVLADVRQHDIDCFATAGYQAHDRFVLMEAPIAAATDAARAVEGVTVTETAEGLVAPFVTSMWRSEWLPDAPDSTVRQLVARRRLLDRAGTVHRLAVLEGYLVVAAADLVVGEVDGQRVAEVDAVAVRSDRRGRGLGDAILTAAARTAAGGGVEVLVLEADADDWPRQWYAARGYADVGPAHGFTHHPT